MWKKTAYFFCYIADRVNVDIDIFFIIILIYHKQFDWLREGE